MDLDGEVVAGVEHLDEDGKPRMVGKSLAEDLLAVMGPELMQGGAVVRALIHDGLLAVAVHDFP